MGRQVTYGEMCCLCIILGVGIPLGLACRSIMLAGLCVLKGKKDGYASSERFSVSPWDSHKIFCIPGAVKFTTG